MRRGLTPVTAAALVLGFGFLYLPIVLLVLYSFNASRLVTVWGGWSLRWYGELFGNEQLLDSIGVTLTVAVLSSTLALVLGSLAGIVLTRFARFRGRSAFVPLAYAPMVMPEVITGLALLLLFVSLDWERGYLTVTVAHATLSMAYVAVLVQSRLVTFDRSLEEAAMDLGAPPAKAFLVVTLPIIAPALIAGWLLAFTLSVDDLVLASFTTGPGATTLPMRIYGAVRLGVTPEINAVSTLLIVTVGLGVIAAGLVQKRYLLAAPR